MKKSSLLGLIVGIILGILYFIPSFTREPTIEWILLSLFIIITSTVIGYIFTFKEKINLKRISAILFYLSAGLIIALQFQVFVFGGGGSYGGADWESLFIGIFAVLSSMLLFIILFFKKEKLITNIFLACIILILGNIFALNGLGYFVMLSIAVSILIIIISIIILIIKKYKKKY